MATTVADLDTKTIVRSGTDDTSKITCFELLPNRYATFGLSVTGGIDFHGSALPLCLGRLSFEARGKVEYSDSCSAEGTTVICKNARYKALQNDAMPYLITGLRSPLVIESVAALPDAGILLDDHNRITKRRITYACNNNDYVTLVMRYLAGNSEGIYGSPQCSINSIDLSYNLDSKGIVLSVSSSDTNVPTIFFRDSN